MKRLLIVVFTLAFSGFLGWGQDFEPEEPGIVLPPMLLQVEDLQVEDVQAALPQEDEQLSAID